MHIQSNIQSPANAKTAALVICLDTENPMSGLLTELDKNSDGFFSQQEKNKTLPEKSGEIRTFYQVSGLNAQSIVLIATDFKQKGLISTAEKITGYLRSHRISEAALAVDLTAFDGLSSQAAAKLFAQHLKNADYDYDEFLSEKKEKTALTVELLLAKADNNADTGIAQGLAIADGMKLLRDLGNAPGNQCTPRYLAKTAKKLAKEFDSLSVEVLKEKDLKAMGMGSLLSVSKGSVEPPRLIKLQHKGNDDDPIIFVGKGVTFDTGGISLKPGAGMDEMKYDMCGAGSVLGLMKTVAMLNLPINVIGIVPTVENMPSGKATKPGDIVTSMSGKTIEILNTDAEGRLILCDALTYAQQFKPKALIDLATLTGAVIIALGRHPSGLMSNNDELAEQLSAAGERAADRVWRLPIWEDYVEQLKSPFADLQNIGGREAGTITAGCFLGEFTKDVAWAHIDIAGTAWKDRKSGATGRPVPLLADYVLSQVK